MKGLVGIWFDVTNSGMEFSDEALPRNLASRLVLINILLCILLYSGPKRQTNL